jgi:putative ABC transport system substrate-binding protein
MRQEALRLCCSGQALGNCTKAKVIGFALCTLLLVFSVSATAQQPARVPRIGYLDATSPAAASARIGVFRQALRELGYVEGKNIVVEYRWAEGKIERVPNLATELVRLKVDVIVTGGPQSTRAARHATLTIPIVMAQDPDPIGNGFIASLARPGGNITGLSALSAEISGKQLELLKETVTRLSRVALLHQSTEPGTAQALRETERAAKALGIHLQYLDLRGPNTIEIAFRDASKAHSDGIVVLPDPLIYLQRTQVADLAVKSRLPTIFGRPEYVEDGGLMSYGMSFTDLYRRGATYVDKILKGAKPADLPVEQPKKFEFIINLKTAKQIGLSIPPNVLARADRVIR